MNYNRSLFIILSGLFIIMVGFGITLPVLPYYIQRLSISDGVPEQFVSLHIGLLTGLFALMQFLFSPIFGILSDRKGRKPLIIVGLAGYSVSLFFFSAATDLWLLYAARIAGGIFSAAFLTGSIAYVADISPINKRGRSMSLFGSFGGLGLVAGPLIGSLFSEIDFHIYFKWLHFTIDKYSTPFLLASFFTIIILVDFLFFLKEFKTQKPESESQSVNIIEFFRPSIISFKKNLTVLLILSFISQFSLAMFEGTFAVHAQKIYQFGLEDITKIFIVCGGVMGLLQLGPIFWLIEKKGEHFLFPIGFAFMSIGIGLLMTTQQISLLLLYVFLLSIGMALITPSLSSLISKNSSGRNGIALGVLSSVNSLAQAIGVFLGGFALIWFNHLPYLLVAIILFLAAIVVFFKLRHPNIKKIEMSKEV